MEEYHGKGVLRSIGLSNYTIEDYEELKPHISVKVVGTALIRSTSTLKHTYFTLIPPAGGEPD